MFSAIHVAALQMSTSGDVLAAEKPCDLMEYALNF